MIKTPHIAAVGLLMTSIAAQIATLPSWDRLSEPVFVAAILTAVGSTFVALFSEKPRDPERRERINDTGRDVRADSSC